MLGNTEAGYPEDSMEATAAAALKEITERLNAEEAGDDAKESEAPESDFGADEPVESEGLPVADEVEAASDEEESEEPAPQVDRKPPTSWKKEAKELWNSLDPRLKDEIDRREQDNIRGISQYKERADIGSQFIEAVNPYMATIQSLGVTPQDAVKVLLNADHVLRTGAPQQKVAMLHKIAKDYGIDVGQLAQQQAEQPQVDPYLQSLQNELDQVKTHLMSQEQRKQHEETEALQRQVADFSKDKPHFEDVKADMAALLQAGRATGLEDAYQMAIYANPNTRALVLAEQQKQAGQSRQAKVVKARSAGAVNVQAKGLQPATKAATGSMDDTLRETYERLMGQR